MRIALVRTLAVCLSLAFVALLGAGCTTSTESYRRGDLSALSLSQPDAEQSPSAPGASAGSARDAIAAAYARKPEAMLPARIAVARLESREVNPSWFHQTSQRTPVTKLTLASKADPVTSAAYQRLAALPEVADLTPLNALVAGQTIDSQEDLREAAARVHADLVYVYTFDTYSKCTRSLYGLVVLSLGVLGFLPLVTIDVEATASGALIDVRSGYVYGVADATALSKKQSNSWSEREDEETARRAGEGAAFEKLNAEFEKRWSAHVAGLKPTP